jgi:hypothetical protein
MKYEVELVMTKIDNCWCKKPQLTDILCDNLLIVCSFKKLDYTHYVSSYYVIQYYINTWSDHWGNYDNRRDWSMYNGLIIRLDPTKINKERRRKIRIPMVIVMKVVSKSCQLEVELVPAEHDLNYQCVYIFCCYLYQNY